MKRWRSILTAVFLTWPWLLMLAFHIHLSSSVQALFSGLAILGAAFLLSWGAEVAQLEVSRSLAIAFVAIVAVLPEYAVDIYIAGKAGHDPSYIPFAVANMTGANRLIIGIAWAMVAFLWWMKSKNRKVKLEPGHRFELSLLFFVTLYSFILPFKRTLSIWDGVILIGFYLYYIARAAQGGIQEEMVLEGPSGAISLLDKRTRRLAIISVFIYAFAAILLAAKPFTESLLETGRILHWEPFLLIQIIAPLASEAPEFIVAGVLAWQGSASLGLSALLSSKFNQWTLLIGMTPIVFCISSFLNGHTALALPLDHRQVEELFLTSAQSLYGIVLLSGGELSLASALALALLYITQFVFPSPHARFIYAVIYIVLAVVTYMGLLRPFRSRSKLSS